MESIAAADGLGTTTRARPQDRQYWLIQKLVEEAAEVAAATTHQERCEELGDLEDVVNALRRELGGLAVDDAQIRKHDRRGGFANFVLLTRHPNTPIIPRP